MICFESLLSLPKLSYGFSEMTSDEIKDQVYAMGKKARSAALALAVLSEEEKNEILRAMAGGIRAAALEILEANARDIAAGEERGLTGAMLDRLRLDETRLEAVAAGVEQVSTLPDPVGEVLGEWDRPNGIRIQQLRRMVAFPDFKQRTAASLVTLGRLS